jgi:hypothetical protein
MVKARLLEAHIVPAWRIDSRPMGRGGANGHRVDENIILRESGIDQRALCPAGIGIAVIDAYHGLSHDWVLSYRLPALGGRMDERLRATVMPGWGRQNNRFNQLGCVPLDALFVHHGLHGEPAH